MRRLTTELHAYLESGAERRREARRFVAQVTIIAVISLAAIFGSLLVLHSGTPGSVARRTYQITIGVELAVLVALVVLLRARLRREIDHYDQQFELLSAQAERLRETSELLQAVLASSPLAIVVLDVNFNIVVWNRAAERLFGWSAAEVLGQPNPMALGEAEADSVSLRDQILREGRVVAQRARRMRKDGAMLELSLSGAVVNAPDGGSAGYVVIAADLGERLKLEGQLRQAQKMDAVGQLAGGVAHDFNNLLTVIASYTELLLLQHAATPGIGDQLREIKSAADRAATLTRQLLAFSRQQVLRPRLLDLNETIAGVERLLRRVTGDDITFSLHFAPDLGMVRADPGQIEQVLLNLAINARDAMPEGGGGTLAIETANVEVDDTFVRQHAARVKPGSYVAVTVSDTGVGMTAGVRERIFEPFFTTKEPGKGTGLGLSTVLGIVEQSGGTIFVYSEPGHGTTFKVYFPRLSGSSEPEPARESTAEPAGGSETILLVEDDAAVSKVAQSILAGAGYRVLEAANGDDALRCMEESYREIDLVLTDVVMPAMGGAELGREMRDRMLDVPVVYMSGHARSALSAEAMDAPNSAFVEKPFTAATLLRVVREMLDRPRHPEPQARDSLG